MEVDNTPISKRHRHTNLIGERDDKEDDEDKILLKNNNSSKILRQWHQPASRIYRVSRSSGGKDRHSKVYTSKGLRDRRVRLSVSTAIQFYDLQDRLGYDQPSKAIEWLIKAADSAIAELPSLDTTFPPDDVSLAHPKQESSTSETSKGSVLSLTSRSEIRVKARERARERTAKDKDGVNNVQNLNPQSSFTELLTGGGTNSREGSSGGGGNFFQKYIPPVTSTSTADYFTQFGQQIKNSHDHHQNIPSEFFGNNDMQQFAFLQQDHFFPNGGGDNYNLNFSISSGLAGFHRGTLQSNSPSLHHHHHQRFSSQLDGAGVPFLFGTAATSAHEGQYPAGFDGHLQHLELKGKGKG